MELLRFTIFIWNIFFNSVYLMKYKETFMTTKAVICCVISFEAIDLCLENINVKVS
jgi:hypothetical protein